MALVLGHGTFKFIVVVGASLDNVLGSGITAVASSLLDLGLFLQGWDDGLSDVAGLEVSIYSAGIGVNQLVVSSVVVGRVDAKDVVLELVILEELVGVISGFTETTVVVVLGVGQVVGGNGVNASVGKGLSLRNLCALDIVGTGLSGVDLWLPSVGVGCNATACVSIISSLGDRK